MIDAFLRLIETRHFLKPAAPQPVKLCACGAPAAAYVHGIPMCGKCALAAMQQTGR